MEILRLGILGGVLGLDGTAVGQFMLSRPLVAGALAGWLVGDVATGVAVGAVLELYLVVSFPTGGARFPEGSTATVAAVGAVAPFSDPAVLPLAVAVGLVWGQVGGASVTLLRQLNTRLVPEPERTARVSARHLLAVVADLVRASLVTLLGVVVGRRAVAEAVDGWPLSTSSSHGLVLLGGAVSAGILLHDLGGFRRRRVWLAAGLAVAIVGARFL